jgi:NAD(P)-dependent dehydrogenase (short-subunit alcohol dehydrogenase family)
MVAAGRLAGRVAIVTGGARGLGQAIAGTFAAEGASVLIMDVRDELGKQSAAASPRVVYVHADVTSEDDWERAMRVCRESFGVPDVFVANAYAATMGTITEETRAGWDGTLAVSLTGAFLGMRAVIPGMRAHGGGAIVAISSTHGGNVAIPQQAAYQAAKAGLTALTRNAAVTYGPDKIRANAIHPGPIRTPMIDELGLGELQERISTTLPLGRVARPEEIASAALYLASDEGSYVTGTALVVDGGYTAV